MLFFNDDTKYYIRSYADDGSIYYGENSNLLASTAAVGWKIWKSYIDGDGNAVLKGPLVGCYDDREELTWELT